MSNEILNDQYWEQRYQNNDTPWDIGYPSPAFVDFISDVDFKSKSILIPGAGNAYEAHWLLENGAKDVTVVDISQSVVEKLKSQMGSSGAVKIINLDFFKLEGQYDLIFEQTFFCALQPEMREAYVSKMKTLLAEDGMLFGLLFNKIFETQGPPFGGDPKEYFELFSPVFKYFEVDFQPHSIPPRTNSELFFKTYNHSIN